MKLFQFKKTLAFILSLCMLISMFAVVSVSAVNNFSLKANSNLSISVNGTDKIICGISESTTVAELLVNFENSESITVCKNDVVLDEDKKVGTGTSVVFDDDIAYVVIEGDTDGNGRIDSTDYLRLKSALLSQITLEGAYYLAADADKDGSLSSSDYLRLKSHFLGDFNLYE